MSRLTKRNNKGYVGIKGYHGLLTSYCYECTEELEDGVYLLEDALNKLAEYEDLEEQGLLLRLPCKVGDRYYRIRKTCSDNWLEPKGKYFPSNHYCVDFCPRYHNGCDGEYIVVEYVFETRGQIISNRKWLGEYLFLSREEAERKLKEMEG